jgi:phospholipase/carboxylesterase
VALAALERPAAGDAAGALVLLHGRGADEHDLYPLLDALDPERRLHGYTPRGPLSLPPGGAHWYALGGIPTPTPEHFSASFDALAEFLDALPYDRIVLGGFSQGCVMSYALALGKGRPRPAALLAMSGFIPRVDGFELDLESPLPPIAIVHGTYDPVIPVEFAREAHRRLPDAVYREYPIEHGIDPAAIPLLRGLVSA